MSPKQPDYLARLDEPPPILHDGINDKLRQAVVELVDAKYLLDRVINDKHGDKLVSQLRADGYVPHDGSSLYCIVFPFVCAWQNSGLAFSARVPTRQVMGADWKSCKSGQQFLMTAWQGPNLFGEAASANEDHLEPPKFMWIIPLGLILAQEADNRVMVYRSINCDYIPAVVTPCDYPSPDRLTIYEIPLMGRIHYWVVLDGRYVQRLEYPEWVLTILKLYGVEMGRDWLSTWPSIFAVRTAFLTPVRAPGCSSAAMVDLEALTVSKQTRKKRADYPILELVEINRNKPFWLIVLGVAVLGLLLLATQWSLLKH